MAFNYDAETWIIIYPHGAGGRLLLMLLSLDLDMAGINGKPSLSNRYTTYLNHLSTNFNAHIDNDEIRPDLYVDQIIFAKKYMFSAHHPQFWSGKEFYKKCNNLKIITLGHYHWSDYKLLTARYKREINHHEKALSEMSRIIMKSIVGIEPVLNLSISELWNPAQFIPIFKKLIVGNNLNIDEQEWITLYTTWQSRFSDPIQQLIKNPVDDHGH